MPFGMGRWFKKVETGASREGASPEAPAVVVPVTSEAVPVVPPVTPETPEAHDTATPAENVSEEGAA